MKLIVDIPDELAEKEHWYTDKEIWTVIKAAQNGIPLEQIRPEIDEEQEEEEEEDYIEWVNYHNKAVNDALLAIDNLCYAKKMIDIYR